MIDSVSVRTSRGDSWELAWWSPATGGHPMRYCGGFSERLETPRTSVEHASSSPRLIFVFDQDVQVEVDGHQVGLNAFLARPRATPTTVNQQRTLRGMEVGISMQAALSLVGTMMGETSVLPLQPVVGRWSSDLHDRLASSSQWQRSFELVAEALHRIERVPDLRLLWAWDVIAHSHGQLSIEELATQTGWSRRHLADRFATHFGVTPKVAARLRRFERASSLLQGGAPAARVAAACGYYDQSHMHRDFAAFAGGTPAELATSPSDGLRATWCETEGR